MLLTTSSLTLLTSLALLYILTKLLKIGHRPPSYPPGPPTLPILGNLHQLASTKRHLQFQKWAQEYGPIYSLVLGTRVMIVLSSDTAVKDLIDKKGAIYASRPENYIAQDVLSGGLRVLFMPDSQKWKTIRQLAHRILNVSTARTYVPYQDLESRAMLMGMLEDPNSFVDHVRRYTASLTTQMTFGYRTTSIQDKRFRQAFDIFDKSSEMIGSKTAAMMDLYPVLRRLPEFMLPIVKEGRTVHEEELRLFRDHYLNTKKKLQDGTAKPCICVDLVRMQKEASLSDNIAAYISGSILQAGSETTASILIGFIQAMLIHPDVAKTAQAEIDKVCGDRLPDLNDVPDLPYIRACAKESLRWMPGFLLGIPHAVTKDDEYSGYTVPRGAMVVLNVWAIHNDPNRHPAPRTFNPMRYINDHSTSAESATNADVSQRDHFVFGAGRRRCQGMHIADRSMYLGISRLLWAFDFKRVTDPLTGKEVVPDGDDLVDGMMSFPKPFRARIVPRSAERKRKMREVWEEVGGLLDEGGEWRRVPEGLIWRDEVETV